MKHETRIKTFQAMVEDEVTKLLREGEFKTKQDVKEAVAERITELMNDAVIMTVEVAESESAELQLWLMENGFHFTVTKS